MVTSKSARVKKINLTYFGKFCQLDRAASTLLPPRPGQSHCWQQQSPGDPRDGMGRICARGDVLSSGTPTREQHQRCPAQLSSITPRPAGHSTARRCSRSRQGPTRAAGAEERPGCPASGIFGITHHAFPRVSWSKAKRGATKVQTKGQRQRG